MACILESNHYNIDSDDDNDDDEIIGLHKLQVKQVVYIMTRKGTSL